MSADALGSHWLDAMIRACWQGAIAAGLAWLACRLILRKASPATRAAIWWLVCLKTLIGFCLGVTILIPILTVPQSPLASIQDRLDLLAPEVRGRAPHTAMKPNVARGQKVEASPASLTPQEGKDWLPEVGMAVWLLGAGAFAIWTMRQAARVKALMRNANSVDQSSLGEEARRIGVLLGLSARPSVAESGEVTSPMVVGLFQPVVLVPVGFADDLSIEEIRMALAHELAHIRRRDLPVGAVPSLCQILFFFFPPMWLVLREWLLEREAACDAEALVATSGNSAGYSRMLLKIVTRDHEAGFVPALGATASYHTLKKRLDMIKTFTHPGRFARAAAMAVVAAGLLLSLPWQISARTATADEPNLLKNAGFESGSDIPNWQIEAIPPGANPPVSISVDPETAHSGKVSLKFRKTDHTFYPIAMCSQEFTLDPNQSKLKVGVWAKADTVSKATVAVMYEGQDGKIEWGAYIGAQNSGDAPVSHNWKHYGAVLAIPPGTSSIKIALQMYGPGTLWLDDVQATYVPASTPLQSAMPILDEKAEDPLADVKDIPSVDSKAGKDPMKRYFLIGPNPGPEPPAGYKLLLVMPGGDGSADFNPFVRRICKNALPSGYIVAELVAPKWSDEQSAQLVWPTRRQRFAGVKFVTEDFIDAVVSEVSKKIKIDPSKVFTLSWSSGGPAAYAASLSHGAVKGSFIAMSVFHPSELPPLFEAKGLPYYIYHSPQDRLIPIAQAQAAADQLKKAGAITRLVSYSGGHGWQGDIFGAIHDGISWLEAPTAN